MKKIIVSLLTVVMLTLTMSPVSRAQRLILGNDDMSVYAGDDETQIITSVSEPCFKVDKQDSYTEITNIGEEQLVVTVIIAEYEGQTLKNVSYMENIDTLPNDKYRYDVPQNGKIFIWNSLTDMKPLVK